jgi:hypothetical protein
MIFERTKNKPEVIRILEVLREESERLEEKTVLGAHISSRRSNGTVVVVILTFYGCLSDGYAP